MITLLSRHSSRESHSLSKDYTIISPRKPANKAYLFVRCKKYVDNEEDYKEICTKEVVAKDKKVDKPRKFKQDRKDDKPGRAIDRPRTGTLAEGLVNIKDFMPLIVSYSDI